MLEAPEVVEVECRYGYQCVIYSQILSDTEVKKGSAGRNLL